MESENRNSQGRFVSGHKGSKPKGAMNKSTREYLARLDKITDLLDADLEENIHSLSKKEKVMFWFEIEKLKHIKLSRFTEPDPAKEQINKITFEVVDSHGKPYVDPDDHPATPVAAVSGPHQPAPVPRPANAPVHYGTVDMSKVRNPNRFSRIKRL